MRTLTGVFNPRLLGGIFSLLLLMSAPALAQKEDQVVKASVVSPEEGATLSGSVTLHGRASSPAGIKRAELLVDGEVVAAIEPSDYVQEVDVTFGWDTRTMPDGSVSSTNGTYSVTTRATANGDKAVDADSVSVVLDNAPQAPSNLSAQVEANELRLSWATNPEPDVFAYQVWRSTGKRFSPIAEVDVAGYYQELEPGTYTYAIVALRRSPHAARGRPSEPSETLSVVIDGGPGGNASFVVDGKGAAPRGLPSGVDLPSLGAADLPGLPRLAPASEPRDEGGYERRLPYKVPREFRLLGKPADARRPWWKAVPPDGLRWLAAGFLLLVVAAQARFAAVRLTATEDSDHSG